MSLLAVAFWDRALFLVEQIKRPPVIKDAARDKEFFSCLLPNNKGTESFLWLRRTSSVACLRGISTLWLFWHTFPISLTCRTIFWVIHSIDSIMLTGLQELMVGHICWWDTYAKGWKMNIFQPKPPKSVSLVEFLESSVIGHLGMLSLIWKTVAVNCKLFTTQKDIQCLMGLCGIWR